MAENLVFNFRINGINGAINNVEELKGAVRATTQAFNGAAQGSKEYDKLKKSLGALKAVQKGVRDGIRKEQRAFEVSTKFAKGSYRQLNAQLVQLRTRYKEMGAAQRKASGKSLIKDIQRLDKELKKLDKGMGLFQRNVGNYGKAFQGVGKILGGALVLGAVLQLGSVLAQTGREMFDLAVQTDTLRGKSLTVLGDAFGDVSARAREVAADLGLSTQQYIEQATAIADVLKPIGFLDTEAGALSTQLVDLSGALAEWSGGTKTAEEAAETLTKALVGEREQLKTYGIVLQEADIKARLVAKGQEELTGNALKQAKAVATLELVMESSTDAQKSFAENSDSLVRTQSRLSAVFRTVQETLATALIPIFGSVLQAITPVITTFAERVPQALQFLGETFAPVRQAFSDLFAVFQQGANEGSVITEALRNFAIGGVRLVANVLTTLITIVTGFIDRVGGARDATGQFREEAGLLTRVFTIIIETLGQLPAIMNGVVEVFKNSGEIITNFFKSIGLGFQIAFQEIKGLVSQEAADQANILRAQRAQLKKEGVGLGEAFRKGYTDALAKVETAEVKPPKVNKQAFRQAGKEGADAFIDTFDTAASTDGPFQKLVNRQKELKESIQDLRTQGKDYTKELEEYERVTAKVAATNALFKTNTDKSKVALENQAGSIGMLQEEIKKLNDELKAADPQVAIDIAEKLVVANQKLATAQKAIDDILKPTDNEEALQKALTQAEQQVNQAKNLRILALNDQQLSEEQYAEARKQIELQAQLEIANQKEAIYKDDAAKQVEAQVEAADTIREIQAETEAKRLEEFNNYLERSGETLGLFQDAASAVGEVFDAQTNQRTAEIEGKYAREIELAAGNADEIARLEQERDDKIRQVERKAFERQKKLQALTATISYFQGIVNILSSPTTIPDPFGAIFKGLRIGFLTSTYAANLANIKNQRFAQLGTLVEREELKRVNRYMANGGKINRQPIEPGKVQTGRTHAQGGNHAVIHGQAVEYEAGEFVDVDEHGNVAIINRANTRRFRKQLYQMAKKRYIGKGRDLSAINSYLGAGVRFAQEGALLPNLSPALANSSPSQTIVTETVLSDEQFARLEATMTAAVQRGARTGTAEGVDDGNRQLERQSRLDENVTT